MAADRHEWAVGTVAGFFLHDNDEDGAREAAEKAGGILHRRVVGDWVELEDFGAEDDEEDE